MILKGCAGLGNRLYTLSRAIEYAVLNNRKLYVDWSDGQFDKKGINPFYDLFEIDASIPQFNIDDIDENVDVFPSLFQNSIRASIYDLYHHQSALDNKSIINKLIYKIGFMFNLSYRKRLGGYWCPNYYKDEKIQSSDLKKLLDENSLCYGDKMGNDKSDNLKIYSDFSPPPNTDILVNNIKLRKELKERIETRCLELGVAINCIGVHVRYSDKKPTKSLDLLFAKCNAEVKNGKKIFLATDNKDIENEFQRNFGDQLLINDKILPENPNQTGVHRWAYQDDSKADLLREMFKESIEDMWLLSRCETLFYQGNSSFSVLSSILSQNTCLDWLKFNS